MFTPKPNKKTGEKVPATGIDHLLMFKDNPDAKPFIDIVAKDSGIMKTYSTYVVGFMQYLRSDGRLHPTYFLFVGNKDEGEGGAITGRLSCHDPAFQVIPKHTEWAERIRRCFPAPPGYVVVERDYSQGELRVFACLSFEDAMIASYKAGKDLHSETSGYFKGFSYEKMMEMKNSNDPVIKHLFKETRQLGKAGKGVLS